MNQSRLIDKLIAHIQTHGPMRFHEFMNMALYDPDYGYYCTVGEKIGRAGDYYTSANIDEAFGALLAQQFTTLNKQIVAQSNNEIDSSHCDNRLTIIEFGAGSGQLAFDIIWALNQEQGLALDQINYLICEASPILQAQQQEKLASVATCVNWVSYEQLLAQPLSGIILANELIDALPVERVILKEGQLRQSYVTSDGTSLYEIWQQPVDREIIDYLKDFEIGLMAGQIAEVSLAARAWLAQIAQILKKGFVLIIDYGDLADHLYSPEHFSGTLRCFYRHTLNSDPFLRIGEQDITSDVNFSALITYGERLGLKAVTFARQADFLIRLGLLERLEQLMVDGGQDLISLKKRLALKNFFVPGGISDHFKVLLQEKI